MKTKDQSLRWLFLREFTKHLIANSSGENAEMKMAERPMIEMPRARPRNLMEASPRTKFIPAAIPQKSLPAQVVKPLPGYADLKKLNMFFLDPRVDQIECYGPEKNILVKVGGSTQKTGTTLTKEEITDVIKEFSEQTRIPLIKGVFRAALGNLTMTAVISDFVDPRFTIQKRAPFQKD